jgi:DNA-binding GntR family transcriptional regulator
MLQFSETSVLDLYKDRSLLEPIAAGAAGRPAGERDLADLAACTDDLQALLHVGQPPADADALLTRLARPGDPARRETRRSRSSTCCCARTG